MGRLRIHISNQHDAVELINALNTWTDKFILETDDAIYRVDAKSILGVLYLVSEHRNHEIYLVNLTSSGYYPDGAKCFQY